MKSHRLARFVAPPPPPRPVCAACKAYAPEVTVPIGDGALDLCWLCAHFHVDHGMPLSECATAARCDHVASEIYPREAPAMLREVVDLPAASGARGRKGQYEPVDDAHSAAVSRGMRAARRRG